MKCTLEFKQGGWECAEALMNWLNTLDDLTILKKDVYWWAMNYRPDKESIEIST